MGIKLGKELGIKKAIKVPKAQIKPLKNYNVKNNKINSNGVDLYKGGKTAGMVPKVPKG